MDSSSGSTGTERPAQEYSRLWEPGAAIPDVFAFLAARPEISLADRLDTRTCDGCATCRCRCAFICRRSPISPNAAR
jgi:hypothetical protein